MRIVLSGKAVLVMRTESAPIVMSAWIEGETTRFCLAYEEEDGGGNSCRDVASGVPPEWRGLRPPV